MNQREKLLQVLWDKETFIDEQGQEISLVEYAPPGVLGIVLLNPTAYTFVDLDGDGTEELVANVSEDYGLYMIFRKVNDRIYGYSLGIRSFNELKADGRFTQSSSAFDTSVARLHFDATDLRIETVASSDRKKEEYTIGGTAVSEVEMEMYFQQFDKTAAPVWEAISYRVISVHDQLEKKIDGTFQEKYQNAANESEARELRSTYIEHWKQIANEYYQKALDRIQTAEKGVPSYDTAALRQHIADLKQNWEKYYQSEMKAFENFYATLYSGGSLTGTVSEYHEYTLCKNWALEIVSVYESLI